MNLLQILADKNIVQKGEISSIESEAESSKTDVEQVLVQHGINTEDILQAKGEYLNMPTRLLGEDTIPYEVLQYIPEESAKHYRFVPLGVSEGVLEVGIVDADSIEALDALSFISSRIDMPFKVYIILQTDFEKVLEMYKGLSGEVGHALTELDTELEGRPKKKGELEDITAMAEALDERDAENEAAQIKEEAPVTKIVATMLRYAVEGGASDIHVEHTGDQVRVRFRIDGILNTSLTLPVKVHRAVVARIKILSSMKLDERRKPQDGRFPVKIEGRKIDFRVSTFPAYYGEKVVMRILDREKGKADLDSVGLREENLKIIREVIKAPYGLVLISGPTGSGKSTTLHGMLKEVDREQKNVLSLEDPVEYTIPGMSQSQIRPEIGYTFANGLRHALRQDPDIIMVGEIRDKETAQLAIQAALTGHLVFSTIHTNNAIGVIPRLIDMGVDPYLIAPTLILAMAQRLVRKLCPDRGKAVPVEGSIKIMIDKQFESLPKEFHKQIPQRKSIYESESTPDCPNGTRGRTGVFELFTMNREIENAILKNVSEIELNTLTRKQGMITMKEDAIIKSLNKIIPYEEVNALGGQIQFEEEEIESEPKEAVTS